ncbi:SANT/Myb domain [Sesbania bispinosa]|nr:SANT/Myb domain [Sesbania bispinosa]
MFLIGLQKLGKGDWRGIASNFVVSRTPTQVASHAQKYFIRQSNATRRKRRSSLFDLPPDMVSNPPSMPEVLLPPSENSQPTNAESQPSLNLSLNASWILLNLFTSPFSMWPSNAASCEGVNGAETSYHQVLKPIPVIPKEPVNVDEFVGISQLSIGETGETRVRDKEPSPLSLKLLGEPSRQSAFSCKNPSWRF